MIRENDKNGRVFDVSVELKDNAMLKKRPDLFEQWDFKKNDELGLNIYKMTKGTKKIAWWICGVCDSSYDAQINLKSGKYGCPYCSGYRVNETNSLLTLNPVLASEWDYDKNKNLTPNNVSCSSGKKVWWICPKENCGSSYDMTISNRTFNNNCPYCSGKRVNETNSVTALRPDMASQWHPIKNRDLTPCDITLGSDKKVWWLGDCGHEWDSPVSSKMNGQGCPYCDNKKILIGFNDMWTTNPELAKLLLNPEDGYKHTHRSNKKIDWKCLDCGNVIKNKSPNSVNGNFSCPICSDGISFPEKVIYNILKIKNVLFKKEMLFDWGNNKRYDFYLYDYNTIIETHGLQHKDGGFERMDGRTLLEEQKNDEHKKELASFNKIQNYIEIDASNTSFKVYKEKILQSGLNEIIDINDICWEDVYLKSSKSLLVEACNYWNNVEQNVMKISEHLSINRNTVTIYLKRGADINICSYTVEASIANSSLFPTRRIVQLTKTGEFVASWDSISDAGRKNNIDTNHIPSCCRGKRKTAYGYKWMYLEDYEKLINQQYTLTPIL
jgi:DNA-directed RNA polymerase subunit RPC12/RpoP